MPGSTQWRVRRSSFFAATEVIEVTDAGTLKLIGDSGAIAETNCGSFSIRVAGVDPANRARWRRRFSHDATVIDLASGATAADFSVGPFHRTLRIANGTEYEWRLAFFMNAGTWWRGDAAVCTVRHRFIWSNQGDIIASPLESDRDRTLLAFVGLFLLFSGRAG